MFNSFYFDNKCEFKNYLKDKRVAVVGPAPYMIDKNLGKIIDNYDIVVRFNRSFPVAKHLYDDYGERTNILYHCMSEREQDAGVINKEELLKQDTWLASPFPMVSPFDYDIINFIRNKPENLKFYLLKEVDLFNEVQQLLCSRPNTGLLGIIDLLNSKIKNLDIFGVTFFKGEPGKPQYIKEYRDISYDQLIINTEFGTHRQIPQIQLFKKMLNYFNNITIDNELKKILEEY